ncbi:unnamed protein product [Durusdinium trenchii]|uniref:carbonic anhydrase n=1 Tax=Durusdinium trenchii TaxID=1381693 RepID=A0ABP0REV2_9DINO
MLISRLLWACAVLHAVLSATAPDQEQGPPWTYADQSSWGKLSNSKCGNEGDQAPINIVTTGALKQPAQPLKTSGHSSTFGGLSWNYTWPLVKAFLGTTPRGWQVMLTPPYDTSTIFTFLNGKQFSLRKLEFTSPSENSIDGQSFDMEMQLVHAASDGQMLISSVFLKVGLVDGNEYLSTFWPQFPPKVTPDGTAAQIANPYYAALPGGRSCFIFNGSGTVPPCGTDTIWMVFKEPLVISRAQRDLYRGALNASSAHSGFLRFAPPPAGVVQPWSTDLGMNNRITQPQGSRPVLFLPMSNPPTTMSFDLDGHFWGFLGIGLLALSVLIGLLALICLLCSGAAKRNVRSKEVYSAESDEDRQPLRRFPQPVANAPMQQRQQMHPQVQLWQQPPSMGVMPQSQMGGRPPMTQPMQFGGPGQARYMR